MSQSQIIALNRELEEARERIRWLEEAMTPPVNRQHPSLRMSRSWEIVLFALKRSTSPINQELLGRWLDAGLKRQNSGSPKYVEVIICRLRKKLGALDPPITILNAKTRGWWIDAENKARLQALYDAC